jgi:hypothetical protein
MLDSRQNCLYDSFFFLQLTTVNLKTKIRNLEFNPYSSILSQTVRPLHQNSLAKSTDLGWWHGSKSRTATHKNF